MCCLAASSIGLCTNAIGVFYTPVSKSLHVLKGTFAMHATLSTLITALTSLKMSKLIRKYNYKKDSSYRSSFIKCFNLDDVL